MPDRSPVLIICPSTKGPWGVTTHTSGPIDPPDVPRTELRRPNALLRAGMIALNKVRPPDLERAARCFREALDLLIERLGEPYPKVSYALDRLGLVSQMRGELEEAERLYVRSLALLADGRAPSPWNDVTLLNLRILFGCQGRLDEQDAVMARYKP